MGGKRAAGLYWRPGGGDEEAMWAATVVECVQGLWLMTEW